MLCPRKSTVASLKYNYNSFASHILQMTDARSLFGASILNTGPRSAPDAHNIDTGSLVSGIRVSLARVGVPHRGRRPLFACLLLVNARPPCAILPGEHNRKGDNFCFP